MTALVLGPHLRHVSHHTATIWVETDRPCEVRVVNREQGLDAGARTFTAHGHHYAVVEIEGLAPGARIPYKVVADGETVWPEAGSGLPPSHIRTLREHGELRISFGSCRRSPGTVEEYGHDALAAFAERLRDGADDAGWPDVLLMVGDQVYADELTPQMREFIGGRRAPGTPPDGEVADYEDYTQLYKLAWHDDPAVRWLLSTVPTFTIFDDHDIRDDWNTSYTWRRQMWAQPWWKARITGGIGSYWIYQHLGNMSPQDRASDPVFAAVRAASDETGDAGAVLDAFAEKADKQPDTTRWSYAHDWAGTRLIVVDSRCSRLLTADRRGMLDDDESAWLDGQVRGGVDHLLIASSLPYLLPMAIHHAESWNEAVAEGAWGRRGAAVGEKIRQGADLEHWAAFERSFRALAAGVVAVGRGERGPAPASISFLSGDVHYSYMARIISPATQSKITQIVCSPLRNPLAGTFRWANRIACARGTGRPFRLLAKLAKVPAPPVRWRMTDGPWFDNAIATVELSGRDCRVRWETPGTAGTLSEMGHAGVT
ncbi:alkaline phosphatase family protein [Actinomadura sp. DSM 109109]|nr:alkaline phosphatase family protein [Actinomadura lepetitiana]